MSNSSVINCDSNYSEGRPLSVVFMLAKREWVRFFRQRQRVIGALGQPILFWLLFGTGMRDSFRTGDQDFMSYFLPGTLTLIVLFTSIFTTISIIEDRREGFLQAVMVAPVPRWTIAAGKIMGGALIAWVQGLIFLVLCLVLGQILFSWQLLPTIAFLLTASITLTALGLCFAWPMESTQGFHAVMSLVLLPMWLLSGAFFPVPLPQPEGTVGQWVMHWIMRANPLSYTVCGIRQLLGGNVGNEVWTPSLTICCTGAISFLVLTSLLAWLVVVRFQKVRN